MFSEHLYIIPTKTVIALDTPWSRLSKDEIGLLSDILKSINHNLFSVQIVEAATVSLSTWMQKPQRLIGFGTQIDGARLYELTTVDGMHLVCADRLAVLLDNRSLKKRLWLILKKTFCGDS